MQKETKQKLKAIQDNIKSDDLNILNQSKSNIDWLINRENERGKSAITRVNILISLSGAISAVILFFIKTLLDNNDTSYPLTIYVIFSVGILSLIISIFYFFRALKPTKQYQLTPEIIPEFQEKEFKKSLRFEIKWKIWEYFQMQDFNSIRLFYLDRGQIFLLLGIIYFLLLGAVIFIASSMIIMIPKEIDYILSVLSLISLYILKVVMDKFGIWDFG